MRCFKALFCFLPLLGSLRTANEPVAELELDDRRTAKEEVSDSISSLHELFVRITKKEFDEYSKDLDSMSKEELCCQYQICSLLENDLEKSSSEMVTQKIRALLVEIMVREHNLLAYIDRYFGSILRFFGCSFAFDQAFNDLFLECVRSDKIMPVEELRKKIQAISESKNFDQKKQEIMLQFASDLTNSGKILEVCTQIRTFMLEEMRIFKSVIAEKLKQQYKVSPKEDGHVDRRLAYAYISRTANRWIAHVEALLWELKVKDYKSGNLRTFMSDMIKDYPWHASFLLQSSYHLLEVFKIGEPDCLNANLVRVASAELQSVSGKKMYYFLEAIPWFKGTAELLCAHGYVIIAELLPSWTAAILPANGSSIAQFFGNLNEDTICEMDALLNKAEGAYVQALGTLVNQLH